MGVASRPARAMLVVALTIIAVTAVCAVFGAGVAGAAPGSFVWQKTPDPTAEADGAAGPPHLRRHRAPLGGAEHGHLRVVRRERGGCRGDHSEAARSTPVAASCCSSAR